MDYPNDEDGDALRRIEAEGSDMSKPMEIDFFVAVPGQEVGKVVAERAEETGYRTQLSYDEQTEEWTCCCSKSLVPTYRDVVNSQSELDQLSKEFGGFSDGWGTYGNAL